MRSTFFQVFLGAALLIGLTVPDGFSQVITSGKDSTVVRTDADPLPPEQKGWSKPGKAALFSAVVPGLGQAYNGSYWKVPIIYATGAVLGYFMVDNHRQYLSFRYSLKLRTDGDQATVDRYDPRFSADQLRRGRDTYRRWRDQTILYSIIAYGLNVTEAYVHAHLKGFDISDELSMNLQPGFIQTSSSTYSPAFTLSFNLKK